MYDCCIFRFENRRKLKLLVNIFIERKNFNEWKCIWIQLAQTNWLKHRAELERPNGRLLFAQGTHERWWFISDWRRRRVLWEHFAHVLRVQEGGAVHLAIVVAERQRREFRQARRVHVLEVRVRVARADYEAFVARRERRHRNHRITNRRIDESTCGREPLK